MPRQETLGQRIRRLRQQRGMSLAKVSGGDFSRALLNQVELRRSQPSTRGLRGIAGRLGPEGDYLLERRLANLQREPAPRGSRRAGPISGPPTGGCEGSGVTPRSSTAEPPESCSRLWSGSGSETAWKWRARRAHRRRCDLEGDDLPRREHDGFRVARVGHRPQSVINFDVGKKPLLRGQRQRRDVSRVQRLCLSCPGAPDLEKVTEREGAVARRLDVNDPGLAGVHVQPVQTRCGPADVGWDGHRVALIEDPQQGVVVHLRVLELVARDVCGGGGSAAGQGTLTRWQRDPPPPSTGLSPLRYASD